MTVSIPNTGTEYAANELTFARGTTDDILSVGVYHTTDPAEIPATDDFTDVTLVLPGDPLAEGTKIDVLSLIGPRDGDVVLDAGTYQRWVYVRTVTEDILRRPDTLVIT